MSQSSLAAAMTSDGSTDLFETEENLSITQRQGKNNEPDYDINPTSTLDFGPESYLTPRPSVRYCSLSLDPPLMPLKINRYDRNECKIINREGPRALHQTASIIFPLIGSKTDNQATSQISPRTPSFKLLPRVERTHHSSQRLKLKFNLRDTSDFCQNGIESKMESHMSFFKKSHLFENKDSLHIQANTIKVKPMKRSCSLTALSAKMESKALRSHMAFHKDGPLYKNIQVNTMKVKHMKRRHSLTAISAKKEPKTLLTHMLFRKYGSLFEDIQANAMNSKPMERSHSFIAMSV